jgi:hypothetical protein
MKIREKIGDLIISVGRKVAGTMLITIPGNAIIRTTPLTDKEKEMENFMHGLDQAKKHKKWFLFFMRAVENGPKEEIECGTLGEHLGPLDAVSSICMSIVLRKDQDHMRDFGQEMSAIQKAELIDHFLDDVEKLTRAHLV